MALSLMALFVKYAPNPNVTRSSHSPWIDCKIRRTTLTFPLTSRFSRFEKPYTIGFADDLESNINCLLYSTVTNLNLASDGNLDKDERIASGKFVPLRIRSRVVSFLK